MSDKTPSEVESLLISYPDGLKELSLICHECGIPSSVLNVIAPWPSLRSLTLNLDLESIPTLPLHIPQPFAALTHLHILSDDTLDLFISFLRAFQILNFNPSYNHSIPSSNLKRIQFYAGGCSPANTWSQFLTSLTHTNTRLEHLILIEKSDSQCLQPSSFNFRPLLAHQSLTNLSTLVLFPGCTTSIILTDPDIFTLARTCPNLHILDLGLWSTPVSLHALNILVRRCRELREVSLCLDARVNALEDSEHADDDNENQGGLQPNTRLIKLELGDSPIVYVGSWTELTVSIPRFLHAMAPRLEGITERGWSHGAFRVPWQHVSDALWMLTDEEGDDGGWGAR
ncbi:hypothetical protein EV702DRAFT_1072241 [Suillus placidus]|uniref:Uncharacterized protein n=1 Tax=Suillus placidus TaxID=48579 RepID=A0A9P7A3A3_9AGAM|nr:hypothetical protein EV702DRAFT_1072241 [Suillus placidus]